MKTIFLLAFQYWFITLPVLGIIALYFISCVYIPESKVGIVIKRFAFKNLQPGEIIALNGEAGYQADTLAPGLHFGFWIVQYHIEKVPMIRVPQGELALIVAKTGAAIPPGRILARTVDCDHFQDARAFRYHQAAPHARNHALLHQDVGGIRPCRISRAAGHHGTCVADQQR